MANYFSSENRAGVGYGFGIADTGSTQGPYRLGEIIRAIDAASGQNLGAGEFIYLKGNATEVEGSLVTYNETLGTTTLVATADDFTGVPLAVSMVAKTAGQYGWYQIGGVAKMAKGAFDFGLASRIWTSKVTAGYITSVSASGRQVLGAITANSASVSSLTSTIFVQINRPHLQGQIT